MEKGYIAGSLFNEAEIAQRIKEGHLLAAATENKVDWYNPIEQPINDKANLPTASDIFLGDTKAVLESDYIVADITNNDVGVAMELGVAYGLEYARTAIELILFSIDCEDREDILKALHGCGVKYRNVYAVCSDIRTGTAHKYRGHHIPYGVNQYLVGGIEEMDGTIYGKFDDALKELVEYLREEDIHAE